MPDAGEDGGDPPDVVEGPIDGSVSPHTPYTNCGKALVNKATDLKHHKIVE